MCKISKRHPFVLDAARVLGYHENESHENIIRILSKINLGLGMRHILFGNDGFGPAVADHLLSNYCIPENAAVVNLGLSTRGFVFDIMLSDSKPKRIIIVILINGNDSFVQK